MKEPKQIPSWKNSVLTMPSAESDTSCIYNSIWTVQIIGGNDNKSKPDSGGN
jgi:hypothetical protein